MHATKSAFFDELTADTSALSAQKSLLFDEARYVIMFRWDPTSDIQIAGMRMLGCSQKETRDTFIWASNRKKSRLISGIWVEYENDVENRWQFSRFSIWCPNFRKCACYEALR